MTIFLYGVIYASFLVFLAACAARALRYARAPLHLRWELYPVPHEEPGRVKHGGSYFEASDWWTKPTPFNLSGELKFMIPEMLFLKGLWEYNRKMWLRSFPFHFGLYLLILTGAAVFLRAGISVVTPGLESGPFGLGLRYLYLCTGAAGAALALLGAAGLLVRRLTDKELRTYTTRGDIFNLSFFILAIGWTAAAFLFRGPGAPSALSLARGLLTFDAGLRIPGEIAAGLVIGALLVAYIPLTHMSHFIAKWFTYHSVRWDDAPSLKGEKIEARIAAYLTLRPTWSAPHVGADGTKTWGEIATTNPARGAKQ